MQATGAIGTIWQSSYITSRLSRLPLPAASLHPPDMNLQPGHKALRTGRTSCVQGVYHVTFSTARRAPIFRDHRLARAACRTLASSARDAEVEFLCWVLMPDHFHGLVRVLGRQTLSRAVQRIKGRACAACCGVPGTPARIWARAFHDHAVRRDEDLQDIARYIIANPLRAGLAGDVMDYPYWDAFWM